MRAGVAVVAESQGPARGYSWAPFEPGHTASLQHGARSERRVGPLAAEIEQSARSAPSWPPYLNGAEYGAAVTAWARAEAVVSLLWTWLDQHAEQGLEQLLAETSSEETDETTSKGRTHRMTTGRRVASALEQLRRWESAAAGHRARLGLDPLSRAKLSKDVAITGAVAGQLERLHAAGSQLVEQFGRPAALSAATDVSGGSDDDEG